MTSGYNNGSIAPINRVNLGADAQVGLQVAGNNTNYYDTSQIAGVSTAARMYEQNFDPSSFSYLSKTSMNSVGLNPFQNNFTEMILGYNNDGTMNIGHTIGIA